jgi:hypothetical protein
MLLWLAGGLATGLVIFLAATVPPSRYFDGACDAFSAAHVVGGLTGAAALAALSAGLPHWRTLQARAAAIIIAGVVTLAVVALTYPACLGDPLAQVDSFVKELWLSQVREAMPLMRIAATRPEIAAIIALPVIFGFIAALYAIWNTRGLARTRWAMISALLGIGLIAGFVHIRVFSSAAPLAALPAAYAVLAFSDRFLRATGTVARALAMALLCLPFSSLAYAIALPQTEDRVAGTLACLSPNALAPLAALSPGLVLAPIDSGSHLLSHTAHSVIAAPYHRDAAGIRLVFEALLASPAAAESIVRESGARYVMLCPQMHQVQALKERAPHGLAALLAEGAHPGWLEAVPLTDTPYRVFTLRPPSSAPHKE